MSIERKKTDETPVRNVDSTAHIPQSIDKTVENSTPCIGLEGVVRCLTKAQRENLISGFDIKNFAKIFEDADAMATVESFLAHGMNISETSRNLYMHRNTLMYRLNKIRDATGLDLRDFKMAVTFKILHILYVLK